MHLSGRWLSMLYHIWSVRTDDIFFSRLAMALETSCNVIAELIDMHFRVIIFYFILKPGLQSDFVLFLTTFSHESFHQTRLVFL